MFSYSQVEAILARALRASPQTKGAFRGRIKHFQRLGVVPSSPGKGKKIAYKRRDIYAWALCLEFAEFGMDPTIVKRFFIACWGRVQDLLLDEPGSTEYLVFYPNIMSDWLSGRGPTGRSTFEIVSSLADLTGKHADRAGAINLGSVRKAVEAAIVEATA